MTMTAHFMASSLNNSTVKRLAIFKHEHRISSFLNCCWHCCCCCHCWYCCRCCCFCGKRLDKLTVFIGRTCALDSSSVELTKLYYFSSRIHFCKIKVICYNLHLSIPFVSSVQINSTQFTSACGSSWQLMAVHGSSWQLMTANGSSYHPMAAYVSLARTFRLKVFSVLFTPHFISSSFNQVYEIMFYIAR